MKETALDGQKLHRYLRVYEYYRDLITSGTLEPGTRLPSIRRCAASLGLSRTTVENAYLLLAAEGYIISRPQSGYYAAALMGRPEKLCALQTKAERKPDIVFDFASSNVDRASFRFDTWRRYIKSALRQDERLLSYGEPQGEWELRESLCGYLSRHRNVVCTPDQIVVGAGVQSLLHILCPMVKDRREAVLYNPQFKQGRRIFEDYGLEIAKPEPGASENQTCCWKLSQGGLFYITPSQMTVWGEVMHLAERTALLKEASCKEVLLIEDDYNSEFRYYNRPIPSLQGLAGGRGVVYLGTFSRLLLPSIRMSYMVLPPELLPLYLSRRGAYNQTASKAEQIALCQFIRDGHLENQIRKSRKLYTAKARELCSVIERVFGEKVRVHLGEAGFLVLAELICPCTAAQITRRAAEAGVAVRPVAAGQEEQGGASPEENPRILLSCSTVAAQNYEEALLRLKEAVFGGRE